ncbi:MAG: ankyrin repeat domain-containing protein [Bacteroidales bacterium]|nr:ankyrin repeat domain-containing protein [Bacteroidales bacterium]
MSTTLRISSFFLIIFLSLGTQAAALHHLDNDSLILASVKDGQLEILTGLVTNESDINREFGNDRRTLLSYAVEHNQGEITKFLLEIGANPEGMDERKTPLMFAARYGRTSILNLLIAGNADVNAINNSRNTAFHYAAKYNRFDILKILFNNGAKINIPNSDQWTALDYSIINNKPDIREYLKSIGCILFEKELPNYFDGPYIETENDSTLRIDYLIHKNGKRASSIYSNKVARDDSDLLIKGIKKDRKKYSIQANHIIPISIHKPAEKIFVMGDIHGQYSRMIEMLKKGGVIDNKLNWKWGNGHLVFVGDILDRGEGVMEAFWLIYKLEQQAKKKNGQVHLVLGNHEAMILKNDIRYIANKYYGLCSNLELDYYKLFSPETIIGDWLRKKNVVEVIGNTMFVHAGISEELLSMNMTVAEINDSFRHFLNCNNKELYTDLDKFIISSYGPVWYRGYVRASSGYEEIKQEALDRVLNHYSVDQIVIGHTEVDLIEPIKNKRVYPVNIPLADKRIEGQALLIESNSFYRITTRKILTKLNNLP